MDMGLRYGMVQIKTEVKHINLWILWMTGPSLALVHHMCLEVVLGEL
jgi:hypothetical protein